MKRVRRFETGKFRLCIIVIAIGLSVLEQTNAASIDQYQTDLSSELVDKYRSAREARQTEQFDDAVRSLDEILSERDDYFLATYERGLVYANMNQLIEARRTLVRAGQLREQLKVENYEVYNALGYVEMELDNFASAEKNFLKVIGHKETNSPVLNRKAFTNLGLLNYSLRRIDRAKKYLSAAANKYDSQTAKRYLVLVEKLRQRRNEIIAMQILDNETGGSLENLVHWGEGENNASMGIGHFIWYPKDKREEFEETFPDLLAFMESKGVQLPEWLNTTRHCPWNSRDEFVSAKSDPRMEDLRHLMESTKSEQIEFISIRRQGVLSRILATLSESEANLVEKRYNRVATTQSGGISQTGVYALSDYAHFKGKGINLNERYNGEGWGLLQVLQEMSDEASDPRREFADSAERILKRRIANAPTERNENRWLKGWQNRLKSYYSDGME